MKQYIKNSFSQHGDFSINFTGIQTVEHDCIWCGRTTRFAVQPEYVDWESVANDYKAYIDKLCKELHKLHQENMKLNKH